MTTAVVLFATAGGIIPPSPSEQEIWDSFDPPEMPDSSGEGDNSEYNYGHHDPFTPLNVIL